MKRRLGLHGVEWRMVENPLRTAKVDESRPVMVPIRSEAEAGIRLGG